MFICEQCLGDPTLGSYIAGKGEVRECSVGHGERRTITLDELLEQVKALARRIRIKRSTTGSAAA